MSIRVIYDGECPFCRSYVQMARLREAAGPVELIDARGAPELVAAYHARGMDIDQGMIVELDGQTYYGGEAVWAINRLLSTHPVLRRLGGRRFLKFIYPALRGTRNLALRMMGRRPIRG